MLFRSHSTCSTRRRAAPCNKWLGAAVVVVAAAVVAVVAPAAAAVAPVARAVDRAAPRGVSAASADVADA